jgi:hypothetical protein
MLPPASSLLPPPGKGAGVKITAFPAGHLIGGAVWRVTFDDQEFVYAVDYNHRKERHLNGTALQTVFIRPALLIADAWGPGQEVPESANRDGCVAGEGRGGGGVEGQPTTPFQPCVPVTSACC